MSWKLPPAVEAIGPAAKAIRADAPMLTDGAAVILTSSPGPIQGTANFSVYSASKAAVHNVDRS